MQMQLPKWPFYVTFKDRQLLMEGVLHCSPFLCIYFIYIHVLYIK